MCEASIHVPHRRAREQEKLVVQALPNMGGMQGLYPAPMARSSVADCGKLVCTRGLTKAIVKLVRFQKGTSPFAAKAWNGKRNIEVTLLRRYHTDIVRFPDGFEMQLSCLKPGTRIDIGIAVKRHRPGGMQMISKAIKEAMALPPEPKPGDDDRPAPAPAPDEDEKPAEPREAAVKA